MLLKSFNRSVENYFLLFTLQTPVFKGQATTPIAASQILQKYYSFDLGRLTAGVGKLALGAEYAHLRS